MILKGRKISQWTRTSFQSNTRLNQPRIYHYSIRQQDNSSTQEASNHHQMVFFQAKVTQRNSFYDYEACSKLYGKQS